MPMVFGMTENMRDEPVKYDVLDVLDVQAAWNLVVAAEAELLKVQRAYRAVLDAALSSGVQQKDVAAALGRHRESLRLDRIQAQRERDNRDVRG